MDLDYYADIIELKKGGMPPRNKKNFRSTKSGAGMTAAGVAAYRRKNPGSKLTLQLQKIIQERKEQLGENRIVQDQSGQMKKFPKAAKDPNSRLRQAET